VGPGVANARHGPASDKDEGSGQKGIFRGSIAQRLISLSTLRREGRPSTTQDLLPAAGPALPGGIGYPQGSNKRFHIGMILLFRASWRNAALRENLEVRVHAQTVSRPESGLASDGRARPTHLSGMRRSGTSRVKFASLSVARHRVNRSEPGRQTTQR
jgi:hypothetical protein